MSLMCDLEFDKDVKSEFNNLVQCNCRWMGYLNDDKRKLSSFNKT